jgi:hypothetical protein
MSILSDGKSLGQLAWTLYGDPPLAARTHPPPTYVTKEELLACDLEPEMRAELVTAWTPTAFAKGGYVMTKAPILPQEGALLDQFGGAKALRTL